MRTSRSNLDQSGGRVATVLSKSSRSPTVEPYIDRVIEVSDYELVREAAAMINRSDRGKLRLLGNDAAEFLQGQVTNDVEALAPGSGCYAALLDHKGKVRTDMRVLRGADWIWLDTEPGFQELLARTVAMYGIGRDVKAEDATAGYAILSLVGPGARSALDP